MGNELAIRDTSGFTSDQVSLIKSMIAVGCSDDELQLFLYTCKRTGLDPLAKQIYAIKRWNKAAGRDVMTVQTSIDGYRLIADRTGKLAGISDYLFEEPDGAKYPLKATVTVKKLLDGGIIADFTATARWGEYVQTYKDGNPSGMWVKMPFLMLGKCAEALALRKAFPADLSGVYTAEEMQQADNAAQGEAVHAEVERQKGTTLTVTPFTGRVEDIPGYVPPELDWSYNATTGVLICRIVEVKEKATAKKREYLVLKLNQPIEGQTSATYFHTSLRAELLAAVGKVCKFMVSMSKDRKFVNVDDVLEVDGVAILKPADPNVETQARLLASMLDMTEHDLKNLYTKWCDSSWPLTLQKLKDEQQARYSAAGNEPAEAEGMRTND